MIRSSKPSSLVCPLATICGSKLPLRSRGIASSIAPSSPSTVLLEWPLRLLPLPRPARSPFSYPRCSLSSAPSARSSSFFLSSLKSPSSPSRSCGELYPCSSSSITSSLIARAMSVIPLLHRVHHGSNLHKISDTLLPPVTIPFLDRRFQPQLDQPKHCAVRDPASYRLHQLAVRNRIEVLGQVSVHHIGVAPADQPVHFLDRIHRPANGTVAIRTVIEVSLEDWFQHKLGSGLNHTIAAMQSLCTLRNHCRQWPRNTRYQADATPYLGRTSTGWIAPACGWRTHSITSSAAACKVSGTV